MYLDFTMAMAKREWLPWAHFNPTSEYDRWIDVERKAYQRASLIFTMGDRTRQSVIYDYGVEPHKVIVVWSAADFVAPYDGPKAFGSGIVLFQGSEFERKGGDVLLDAFKIIQTLVPAAQLYIVGTERAIVQPGVRVLGYVAPRERMADMFVKADLVIAPARCDPFTAFVIEAMNYGVPCIVSRESGVSEIIESGVNGLVVASDDAGEIAAQAVRLLTSPQSLDTMSCHARDTVKRRLNWDAVAAAMASRIRAAITQSGAGPAA
jgi:glycosyltransferase involved in cell wall biosynthesis